MRCLAFRKRLCRFHIEKEINTMSERKIPYKIYLEENEMPRHGTMCVQI